MTTTSSCTEWGSSTEAEGGQWGWGGGPDGGRGGDDDEGSSSDDGENKAMYIPFMMTPSRIMWYKCPICLGEEYGSEAKVVLHALEVIKQDMVEWHCQVLQARRRRSDLSVHSYLMS
jgi:hypothetical protein